jgi:uncharacterized protein
MKAVKEILSSIEQQYKIKILYACETGSRAWGFPSPDSDYDIRFIYMNDMDWYLSLAERKDTIEYMDGDWDITGWDLKKSLVLLKKSNAPLIERFCSPIEYFADESFKLEFKKLIAHYYSPTAVFFHHYSLALKFWEDIKNEGSFKLKNLFYLIRSLFSCNWIIHDKSVLPMHIEGLMKYVDDGKKEEIRKLIQLKATVGEKYMHQKETGLYNWITGLFEQMDNGKNNLGVGKSDYTLLNEFFLKTLYAAANDRMDKE